MHREECAPASTKITWVKMWGWDDSVSEFSLRCMCSYLRQCLLIFLKDQEGCSLLSPQSKPLRMKPQDSVLF